jgi:hypothetical protein
LLGVARAGRLRQGVRVDDREGAGERVAAMRLIQGPVVDAAGDVLDDQSDTAELPAPEFVLAEAAAAGSEPLVAPPGTGLRGWTDRFRDVLRGCGAPLLLVAALTAGPTHLYVGRVSDTIIAVPLLSDVLGGAGLLLLPLMWVAYLAMAALPIVLCLAAAVGVIVGWATDGGLPSFRTVLRLVGHRIGVLWAWLAVLGAISQALPVLIASDAAGRRLELALSAALAVASSALAVLMGVLGCVVLFERGHGLRRTLRLLAGTQGGALVGLVGTSVALTIVPSTAGAALGPLAASPAAVACVLLWAVASLVTYAQARRAEGVVTSGMLRAELAD